MNGRGVPLSLVVTGANRHDVTQLEEVLRTIKVKRKMPSVRRSKHLCADNGYRGKPALAVIESQGYIPHVVGRQVEAQAKRRGPTKKVRRWLVEVCHNWFNRFRKLLVRYEKLERSFVALNHIAAAILAYRKVKLPVEFIYGYVLRQAHFEQFDFHLQIITWPYRWRPTQLIEASADDAPGGSKVAGHEQLHRDRGEAVRMVQQHANGDLPVSVRRQPERRQHRISG